MCNILIVTPDFALKKRLVNLLNKYFVNVFMLPHAASGKESLAIAKETDPEIVILDLTLPNENPFSVQKTLLEYHPNLRSIIIDSTGNYEHAQKAMRFGATDYLVQPLKSQETLSSIHRAIISLNQVSLLNHGSASDSPTQNETILPMIQYIHRHYAQDITLDSLADFMHLNKNYLCQLFRKEVGMTYIAYLNEYRIEQSKILLRETTLQLSVVAEQVGYNDPAYYSRIFKKTTTMSPNQYRQTYKGDYRAIDLEQLL